MSILNSNEIGVIRMKVSDYYETSAKSLRYTNYANIVDEILGREYAIESMPTPAQLYRMIAEELGQYKLDTRLVRSNIVFLEVDRGGVNLGWIYILYKS